MTKLQLLLLRFRMRPAALNRAIHKANVKHLQDGKRYRVFFFGDKYRVWTRDDIKQRKNSGLFKDHLKAGDDFDTISFYDTNNPEPCTSVRKN